MNAPDPFAAAPDWWLTQPWSLPEPIKPDPRDDDDRAYMFPDFADDYQQEQIDSAQSEAAFAANVEEFNRE